MKRHRNALSTANIAGWPEFDPAALAPDRRSTYAMRRLAVELYAAGTTVVQIEAQTRVNRRQLYRLLVGADSKLTHRAD